MKAILGLSAMLLILHGAPAYGWRSHHHNAWSFHLRPIFGDFGVRSVDDWMSDRWLDEFNDVWLFDPVHRISSSRCHQAYKHQELEPSLLDEQDQSKHVEKIQRKLEDEQARFLFAHQQAEARLKKQKAEQLQKYQREREELEVMSRNQSPEVTGRTSTAIHQDQTSRSSEQPGHCTSSQNQRDNTVPVHEHQNTKPRSPPSSHNQERATQPHVRSHQQPQHTQIVSYSVSDYFPDDLSVKASQGQIKVKGHHICRCDENCIERDFTRVFQVDRRIDPNTVQATLDAHDQLKITGTYSNGRRDLSEEINTIKVHGIGVPQSDQSYEDKVQCLKQKGGIKLNKIQKKVPRALMNEIYQDEHNVYGRSQQTDDYEDEGFVEIEY